MSYTLTLDRLVVVICVQDERDKLLKSLQEQQAMRKRLVSELSQYKDCDPATITHIRMCIIMCVFLYHSLCTTVCAQQVNRLELQWMPLTDGQVYSIPKAAARMSSNYSLCR